MLFVINLLCLLILKKKILSTLELACMRHFSVNNIADLCHHHRTHDALLCHYYYSMVDLLRYSRAAAVVVRHCRHRWGRQMRVQLNCYWHRVNVNSIRGGSDHHHDYCCGLLPHFLSARPPESAAVYFWLPTHVCHDGFAVAAMERRNIEVARNNYKWPGNVKIPFGVAYALVVSMSR